MSAKPLFENPEITAMAEICQILQALEDDAARLRVMRWSFARFGGEEFKRPLPKPSPAAIQHQPAAVQHQPVAVQHQPTAVQQQPAAMVIATANEEIELAVEQDIAGQVSELKDLFSRPASLVLNRLRSA